eukprot:comp17830_c0_seq1/m.17972 comp17830_c0_seq1/g.17972  ORF comp17830_c0_seq1/g.17972 comp17830_c0_seq1/m.17972 type:complete len:568 (-) comp17830_c0_seq1:208-1911(-)
MSAGSKDSPAPEAAIPVSRSESKESLLSTGTNLKRSTTVNLDDRKNGFELARSRSLKAPTHTLPVAAPVDRQIIVRIYSRLPHSGATHSVKALCVSQRTTCYNLLRTVLPRFNVQAKDSDIESYGISLVRNEGESERVFQPEEQPFADWPVDSTEDARFYVTDLAFQSEGRKIIVVGGDATHSEALAELQATPNQFTRQILQAALQRLNVSANPRDYTLIVMQKYGTESELDAWDCPASFKEYMFRIRAKQPQADPVEDEAAVRRNKTLVGSPRLSRLRKSFRRGATATGDKYTQSASDLLHTDPKDEHMQGLHFQSVASLPASPGPAKSGERRWKADFMARIRQLTSPAKKTDPAPMVVGGAGLNTAALTATKEATPGCEGPGLFGATLDAATDGGKRLPVLLAECMAYLEREGLEVRGLYRVSGNVGKINTLKAAYHKGQAADLNGPGINPHAVTGLVKAYLRELPENMLTKQNRLRMTEVAGLENDGERLKEVTAMVAGLPQANYMVLQAISFHLAKVASMHEHNMMNAENLAICISPTVNVPRSILRAMIENPATVFARQATA